jgi:hypothetical protein
MSFNAVEEEPISLIVFQPELAAVVKSWLQ